MSPADFADIVDAAIAAQQQHRRALEAVSQRYIREATLGDSWRAALAEADLAADAHDHQLVTLRTALRRVREIARSNAPQPQLEFAFGSERKEASKT